MVAVFYVEDGHPYDEVRVRRALGPLLADDTHGQVWLLQPDEPGADAAGYAVLTWGWSLESGGREGLLDELYVAAGWRRSGWGGLLIEQVIAQARAAGCGALFLETVRPNDRARAFYRRHGLVGQDSIWMRRELG
ncbi:GNAT family N-acetyltransferase [Nocardioides sp. BP30]|uniref:GNAT family N-acetyltransferase n=1 Tax=Nocardioides sp. BP30 TaxID=3036374 RepID=UPI002468D93E|nr:GNAT family N-acetyltransferase [Nocardioides sp. BP30]WGL53664.1 GNAT family N-acetyltransferase [Nocardioides sp. BP30]